LYAAPKEKAASLLAKENNTSLQAEPAPKEGAPVMAAQAEGGAVETAHPENTIMGVMAPFLGESFQTDLATGAATLSIAITVLPGRRNMQPKISLSYSSNNSNGICGVGWSLPLSCIQRSTKNGTPKYNTEDTFVFISGSSNSELINIGGGEYRAKIENAFMKYVFLDESWSVYDKSGTKYTFGSVEGSRIINGEDVFAWYLEKAEDLYGNYIDYTYEKPGDGQIYLKRIDYTVSEGLSPDKSVVFYYDTRTDKLYSYRSGWKISTSKRLSSIEVLLNGSLVWLYKLDYIQSPDTERSLLSKITVYDKNGNSLPPKVFSYQRLD
jgi:hypothetical protein